jgi:hypothetical protein
MTNERAPTNVPCARCGAPMREHGASHLAAAVEVRCGCCGAAELLPADAQQRVLALRSLALQRRWAQDAASGPALTYLRLMESGAAFLLPYAFAALLVVGTLLGRSAITRFDALPIGVVGGALAGTYVAFRIARRRLRATLGPLIRSFPGAPGRPQRCRRCGGELPAAASAFVECAYCGAANLSSHAAAVERAAALRGETADALLHAAETASVVAAAGRFVGRAFMAAFVVGAVGGTALAVACSSALQIR